jgi:tripartite ATP-independent transporter DctM subunit
MSSAVIIASIIFLVLLFMEIPIPWAILSGSVYYAFTSGENLLMFSQKLASSFADRNMLAIPCFLFVGLFMGRMGLTDRLFHFAQAWIGHITGGLAHANIWASVIFAGMSGSALADAGGLGVIEVQAMDKANYDRDFSVAITAASSTIGPIIPPSINLLVWGYLASVSAVTLFAGGVVPGLLMAVSLMTMSIIMIKAYHIRAPKIPKCTMRQRAKATWSALPAMGGPIILLAGTLSGAFTPSECGVVASVYCIIIGCVLHRVTPRMLLEVFKETSIASAMCFGLCATGNVFNWMVLTTGLLDVVSNAIMLLNSPWLILLVLNIIMLALGCFMGSMQVLILLSPLLINIGSLMGISLVQIGVMSVLNLVIGAITPPFAPCLYVTCKATNSSVRGALKYTCLFVIPLFVTTLMVTYIPVLTEGLPRLLGMFIK